MLAFVDELLIEAGIKVKELDALAFSAGPGSFTGIRLAASTAKSLAYAANIPVIAVSSLAVLAQTFYRYTPEASACTVITDARMAEIYLGQYVADDLGLMQALQVDKLLKLAELETAEFDRSVIVGDAQPLLDDLSDFYQSDFVTLLAHALDVLPQALRQLQAEQAVSAMDAQAIYLRGKSGWKTTVQQLAEKALKNKV